MREAGRSWHVALQDLLEDDTDEDAQNFCVHGLFLSLSGSGLNFLSGGCFSKSHRGETLSIYNNAITLIIKDGTHLKFAPFGVIIL